MERVRKQDSETAARQHAVQRKTSTESQGGEFADRINNSPEMIAQRKKLDSLFGGVTQRVEEEELLQGKFETAQRVEEEEPLQGKFETAQRVEEEEPLQGKFETTQRVEEEEPLQGKFEAASSAQLKDEAAKPNNTGLPDNLKNGIESLSGMSMDDVKVHYNSSQPAQLNALAYAQGTDIHVAPGQEKHLPHEAWHVVQQAEGRVQPTMQMKDSVLVNDDKSLEHEADVMGAKALASTAQAKGQSYPDSAVQLISVVQRVEEEERPIYDEKMTELISQTKVIVTKLGKEGRDWENNYRLQGREKAQKGTEDALAGKKPDYAKIVLKKIWGELTAEQKLEVARATGGALWEAARATGTAISELPSPGLGDSERRSGGESRSGGSGIGSAVVTALNEVTIEDAQNAYKVYKKYSQLRSKINEAMDNVVKTAGDAGESAGAFFGSMRDKQEFAARCEEQKRGFAMAAKRYGALAPQVDGDSRYTGGINALNDALIKLQGPGRVYLGLADAWEQSYREVCDIALNNLNIAQDNLGVNIALRKGGELGGRIVSGVKGFFGIGSAENPDTKLLAAQEAMVTKLRAVTNKSWSSKTFFFSTPKGVSAIKRELAKDAEAKSMLDAIKELAKSYGSLDSSKRRSAETQIFYDAVAKVDSTDLNSLRAATSKADDVLNML